MHYQFNYYLKIGETIFYLHKTLQKDVKLDE